VLAYHDVPDAQRFELQMKFLKRHYRAISVTDLDLFLQGKKKLPHYAVLVTFDDGDPTVKLNAVPVLKKYGIPAVAFIISENIRYREKFWWKVVQDYFVKTGRSYQTAREEVRRLKKLPNFERMEVLMQIRADAPEIMIDNSSLDLADLHSMEKNLITIGSHTAHHPILNHCTIHELENEFAISKDFFSSAQISTYSYFAYPNGDYYPGLIPMLEQFGIDLAFTFDHNINKMEIDRYAISRIRTNADDSLTEFKLRISGISSFFPNAGR
jgi:peptidoglycan/xylan/chitin deacetylase (PgdA/CDA1 family)